MDPSTGGIFTMRSRLLMPKPQVTLQGSHSAHSVTTQLLDLIPIPQDTLQADQLIHSDIIHKQLNLRSLVMHPGTRRRIQYSMRYHGYHEHRLDIHKTAFSELRKI
ncbi:hypothetical protein EYF80_015793 [Liparis tanakae]|uniref:Uncharacterized protein n=1 Tax=Liparis tanakae TaxID=230148 RepID=A0A4Z2I998_9TELE|nr:hypothetical protein EYF80_015793 [Liparis tanakae]